MYIFCQRALASYRWSRLTSNVRHHQTKPVVSPTGSAAHSAEDRTATTRRGREHPTHLVQLCGRWLSPMRLRGEAGLGLKATGQAFDCPGQRFAGKGWWRLEMQLRVNSPCPAQLTPPLRHRAAWSAAEVRSGLAGSVSTRRAAFVSTHQAAPSVALQLSCLHHLP